VSTEEGLPEDFLSSLTQILAATLEEALWISSATQSRKSTHVSKSKKQQ